MLETRNLSNFNPNETREVDNVRKMPCMDPHADYLALPAAVASGTSTSLPVVTS